MPITKKAAQKPKTFVIELKEVNGMVIARGDFENKMLVGDFARFTSDPKGQIVVQFTPRSITDKDGNPIHDVPFEHATLHPEPTDKFEVKHACKAVMAAIITTPDGRKIGCPTDDQGKITGTHVCSGGGTIPCH